MRRSPSAALARAVAAGLVGVGAAGAQLAGAQVPGAPAAGPQPGGPPVAAAPRRVRVVGVVVDSLRGRPLAGATLHRPGAAAVAFTDSGGRFVLDDVPAAPGAFVVGHAGLDALGFPDLALPYDLSAAGADSGGAVHLTLATPSRATLRARLCGVGADGVEADGVGADRVRTDAADGALYGEVRDPVSGDRLAGAAVRVRWIAIDSTGGGLQVRPERRQVRTDAAGAWALCGVPAGRPLEVRAEVRAEGTAAGAEGAEAASGRREVTLAPALPLARVDLWLAVPPPAPAARDTGAVARAAGAARRRVGVGVVRGIVRDSTGAPRLGARVTLDDPARGEAAPDARGSDASGSDAPEARTSADGRFTLAGLPLGSQTLVVRALGYAPQYVPVVLRADSVAEIDLTLRRVVTLARVTAWARGGRLGQLFVDIERRGKLGVSLAPDVSIYHRTHNLGATIGTLPYAPTLNLTGRPTPGRVGCTELTLLDGVDAREELPVRPEEVIAIEFFRPYTQSPRWHGGLESHPCPVTALYTERWAERKRRR